MSKKQRRYLQLLLLTAMTALVAASLAWACTPDADIDITPSTIPSGGATIDVTGAKFVDGSPVEIRWNAVDGPLLGTATAEAGESQTAKFTVPVTAPRVAADDYTILAIGRDASGNPVVARAQLVVGERSTAPAAQPERSPGRPAQLSGAEHGRSAAASSPATRGRGGSPGAQAPARAQSGAGGTDSVSTPSTDTTRAAARTQPGSADAPARTGREPSRAATRPPKAPEPSARTATGDLWGAYQSGKASTASRQPAVAPAPTADGGRPQLVIGVAMLGLGLVALLGAFTLAQLRRRRVPAGTP